MSLEHAKKHAKAYDHVVTIAKELAAFARCRCHECWTGRGRHDPHGCLWADIEDLRLAVEALDSVSKEQNEEPDLVSAVPSETSCGNGCDLAEPQQLCGPPHRENVPEDSGGVSPDPTRTAPLGANVMNRSSRPQAGEHRSSETHPCLDCGRPTSYFAQKMRGGHWLCRDGEGCNVPRASEALPEKWRTTESKIEALLNLIGEGWRSDAPTLVTKLIDDVVLETIKACEAAHAAGVPWHAIDPDSPPQRPNEAKACESCVALQATLTKVDAENEANRKKWWDYEQQYVLPCFKWANEVGLDLAGEVRAKPGNNCVALLVRHLIDRVNRTDKAKVEESKPNPEVYSRPECIWNYCCDPEGCIARNACQNPSRSAPRAETAKAEGEKR